MRSLSTLGYDFRLIRCFQVNMPSSQQVEVQVRWNYAVTVLLVEETLRLHDAASCAIPYRLLTQSFDRNLDLFRNVDE